MQFAAILTDDACIEEISTVNLLIKPNDWKIDPGAEAVHGISQQFAEQFGVPVVCACGLFFHMAKRADLLIAFNYDFDSLIMAVEMCKFPNYAESPMASKPSLCEMKAMTPICRLPGGYRGEFKWPKLQEAYRHCFNESFDGAHDALADVRAMIRVHKWRIEQKPAA